MKNYEIVNIISDIKPESYGQWKKLKTCMLMFLKDEEVDYTDEYVSTLTESRVLDRPCIEVYEEYVQWCKLNYINPVHINAFSKYLRYYFNVSSKLIKGKKCYCK